MSDDDRATLHKLPVGKSRDRLVQQAAEQSTRADTLTVHVPGVGKILATIHLNEELVVGRFEAKEASPLYLNLVPFKASEAGVSRRHAKLKHDAIGWWIEDMGSSNGTWVNGERLLPLNPCRLQPNTQVMLGQFECYLILPVDFTK